MANENNGTPAPSIAPVVNMTDSFRPARMIDAILAKEAPAANQTPAEKNVSAESTIAKVLKASAENIAPNGEAPAATEATETAETVEAPAEPKKITSADRKEWMAQQKRLREIQVENKRLREEAKKAPKIDFDWKKEPTKVMQTLGIDPTEFYQAQTQHYLNHNKPIDPIEEKLQKQVDEKVSPYIKALEEEKAKLEQMQVVQAEARAISQFVVPLMQDSDKYECVILMNDGDKTKAAMQVYAAVKQHYLETGEKIEFADAAAQMDKQYEELLDRAHKTTLGSKRFSNRYKDLSTGSTETSSKPEQQQKTTKTLTNQLNPAIQIPTTKRFGNGKKESVEDRINAVLEQAKITR